MSNQTPELNSNLTPEDMRKTLQRFLDNSTPEQLREELQKHSRPPLSNTPEAQPSEVQLPVKNVVTLNIDDIKPNSILVINVESAEAKQTVLPTLAKLLSPFTPKLKEKHVALMIMGPDDSIETLSEEAMNKMGWHKKEESRIIIPR